MTSSEKYIQISTMSIPLLLVFLIYTVNAIDLPLGHTCSNSSLHISGSPFYKHLSIVFTQLTNKVPLTGFALSAVGAAHGLALCRGDVSSVECKSCIETAAKGILPTCPHDNGGLIWYDNCFLKFSNTNFFHKIDLQNRGLCLFNVKRVNNTKTFNEKTEMFLNQLGDKASRNLKLFAASEMSIGGSETLYGLVQCTKDLSSVQCKECLDVVTSRFPYCSGGKRGGRVYSGSCSFRYELSPFVHP